MSKVVKTIALVAIAVAVVVFAAPIAGVLASAGAALGIGAGVVTAALVSTVVGIGLSIGLSAIGGLFRKTPNLSQSMVDRLNNSVVPATPRKIVFGTTAAGNDIRYFEEWGSKKDRYAQVTALASHKVTAIKEFWVEDKLTWNGGLTGEYAAGFNSFRAVEEGSAANAQAMGSGSYWTTSSKFTGCAYLAIDYKLDNKAWPQGLPQKTVTVVDGCPVYDPRRDSANGGAGSHRPGDQLSWQFNEGATQIGRNPALCLLTYLLGYRINGKVVWGMGVPLSRISLDNFRAYANVCEEGVLSQAGTTVQRYTCDGIFSTADSHETVINALTAAMGSCKLTDVCGQYQLIGGYDDTLAPKQGFTDDDLVAPAGSAMPFIWTPSPSTRETYNIARGKFANPAELYQLVDWGTLETEPLPDAVPRTVTIDLGCVSRAETCQRIAKQFLVREAKCPGMFAATFGPKAFGSQVGSLVTLSLNSMGWNNKLFRIMEQAETHDMIFQMTLREESPEIYAWDKEEKPLPAVIRPPGYNPADTIQLTGLSVTTETYLSAN